MNTLSSVRTVLWMFLLSGCLLAIPIKIDFKDFGFEHLTKDVSCGNVTFESPRNIEVNCHAEALNAIKGGLDNAKTQCGGELRRINQTLRALRKIPLPTTSSNCTWGAPKKFEEFVKDIETFVAILYNIEASASKTTRSPQ